jgi:acetyl-CoA synthetase
MELHELLAPFVPPEYLEQTVQKVRIILSRHPDYQTNPESQVQAWLDMVQFFRKKDYLEFPAQHALWNWIYKHRKPEHGPPIVWRPTPQHIENAHVTKLAQKLNLNSYAELHRFSVQHRALFWEKVIEKLKIVFKKKPKRILDTSKGVENPDWLSGAKLNIVDSCFQRPAADTAIIWREEGQTGHLKIMTYKLLEQLTNRVANGLMEHGFRRGDFVALDMPMIVESVAIYLGIIKAGCAAVSIPDSFSPPEIERRLKISNAKGIFTVDFYERSGKKIEILSKVYQASPPKTIVIPLNPKEPPKLRPGDLQWAEFLSKKENFTSVSCAPNDITNILFSSGTTGDPKAIPWTHLTPIKSAMDAYYHQDIRRGDVVCWPTNIGWMMGPWLIYASLINGATIALFYGAPSGRSFGEFVRDAGVTMLGTVPTLVKHWLNTQCMKGLDWSSLKVFSSTGEASFPYDYLYLMSLAQYRAPVIEYCGGTEVGGGYITGTVVQDASPSTFTTPALGIDFVILDAQGKVATTNTQGQLYLIPPSIGLSQTLLNRDHFKEYYAKCPKGPRGEVLRYHGDQMVPLPGGFFQALGRADDTMNLGGIKVSSAELERVMGLHPNVGEVAAVAVQPPGGGADELIVFIVPKAGEMVLPAAKFHRELQQLIRDHLNPLFHITDVRIINELPKTASNKIMRRLLRDEFVKNRTGDTPPRAKL